MLLPPPSLLSSLRSNAAPALDPASTQASVVEGLRITTTGRRNGHYSRHFRARAELAVALPEGDGVNVYDVCCFFCFFFGGRKKERELCYLIWFVTWI